MDIAELIRYRGELKPAGRRDGNVAGRKRAFRLVVERIKDRPGRTPTLARLAFRLECGHVATVRMNQADARRLLCRVCTDAANRGASDERSKES